MWSQLRTLESDVATGVVTTIRARIWSTLSVGDRTVRSSAEQDKVNEVLVWSHLRAGQRSCWCGHTLEVLEADEVAGVVTT